MGKFKYFLILCFCSILSKAYSVEFPTNITPAVVQQGGVVMLYEEKPFFFSRDILDLKLDGISNLNLIKSKSKEFILLQIPNHLDTGLHKIDVYLDDNAHTSLEFRTIKSIVRHDTTIKINDRDPNPETQYGEPHECGKNPQGHIRPDPVIYPNGGFSKGSIPCDSMHVIDGMFTDSIDGKHKEWSGIIPITGRFSNFYVDYCDKSSTLYIMNDWILGDQNTDSSTCYNMFEFVTGGSEYWTIKVYNAISKKIQVFRNYVDVSNDTNIVLKGAYGFNPSILEDSVHAMWEFGIKTMGGMFVMVETTDPTSYLPKPNTPTVTTICNEETGYGLITEPIRVVGELGHNGITLYGDKRYIPLGEIGGLTKEPYSFSGTFSKDSSSISVSGQTPQVIKCSGGHKVDGLFTNDDDVADEWLDKTPAIGKYSNLYADYCDSVLYILNDWLLATAEPDEGSCYNLFELYTGGGKEHWGIYVYHDLNKGIKVFRNGIDVSKDSNIVMGGAFGFTPSPNLDTAHTIYEFGIKCSEGSWNLFLADPGPSTFCDQKFENTYREASINIGLRKLSDKQNYPGENYSLMYSSPNDTLLLALGTNEEMKDLFSRQFRCILEIDTNNVEIISVSNPTEYLIHPNQTSDSIIYRIEGDKLIISGKANENYSGSGDLYLMKLITKFKSTQSITFIPKLELGNRTSFLRKIQGTQVQIIKNNSNVDEHKYLSALSVFPNPISNNSDFNIKFNLINSAQVEIKLFDELGHEVKSFQTKHYGKGENSIIVKNLGLATGAYFLNIKIQDRMFAIPIQIIN